MGVRTRLRRVKRLAYLGGLIGAVVALRQAKARRAARTNLGPPATWPPLEVGEAPVAALGDLATADEPAPAGVPEPVTRTLLTAGPAGEPVVSDEPVAAVGEVAADAAGAAWVEPADGSCPTTHPIKVNGNSGIYHEPGGAFYARTRAQRCYVDVAAAEADGYRAAKSS